MSSSFGPFRNIEQREKYLEMMDELSLTEEDNEDLAADLRRAILADDDLADDRAADLEDAWADALGVKEDEGR